MEVLGNVLCDDDSQMVTDAINEWIAKGAEFVVCTGGMSLIQMTEHRYLSEMQRMR